MSDCQGKVGTSGTGLTNVIAPLSLTGTELSLNYQAPLSISGSNLTSTNFYCMKMCYLKTAPAAAKYVLGSAEVGGTPEFVVYTDSKSTPGGLNFSQGTKGLVVPFAGYYRVSYDVVWGGTVPQLFVGYFLNSLFYNRFYTSGSIHQTGTLPFYVPSGGEIYIFLNSGNLTNSSTSPHDGGAAVTTNFPNCSFSVEFIAN
jgi:hypothetical protein